jgi:MFS family permease
MNFIHGSEVTIVGVISAVLQKEETLGLSSSQIGLTGTVYILGCIIGSLVFGYLADKVFCYLP